MADKNITEAIEFHANFGWFCYAWAITEAAVDWSIGKFLRLNFQETHILTACMRALIVRSDHKNKAELMTTLNIIQNENIRNIFAHSYIGSDAKTLTFIERRPSGLYKAKEYNFTLEEFVDNIGKFAQASSDFVAAMAFEEFELQAFQHGALSVRNKS